MNTENIYDAVSGVDRKFVAAADNIEAVRRSFQRNRARKTKIMGTVLCCALLVIAAGWISAQNWFGKTPSVIPNDSITAAYLQTEPNGTEPDVSQPGVIPLETENPQTETKQNTQESASGSQEQPASSAETTSAGSSEPSGDSQITPVAPADTTDPLGTSSEEPAEPSANESEPGTPGSVFSNVSVSYDEAKEIFAHPIAACGSSDFLGYKVGIVSRQGDIHESGAFCLSVTYTFTNGTVSLEDQDRWSSSSYSAYGEAYEYLGRIFYVQPPNAYQDYVHIGYWPTFDSGIGYQAHFNADADVYEIMDLILSLEL